VWDYFVDGAKAAGLPITPELPGFSYHQLRHGFATRLLSAGLPISTVSAYLGHSAAQTTETYSHVLPDSDEAARAILDA
jgi:integrase